MIGRFISSLRRELAPLVEAKLREELTPKIYAAIEAEARNRVQMEIHADFQQRSESARREMEQVFRAHASAIDRTLGSLASDAKTAFAGIFDSSGAGEVRERILREVNLLVATRIETLRSELAISIRTELEPGIQAAIANKLRDEIREELDAKTEAERKRLLGIFREGLILQYVTEYEAENIRSRAVQTMRPEVEMELRKELRDEVFRSLLTELRQNIEEHHTAPLISELRSRLKSELMPLVHAELSVELKMGVRNELIVMLTPGVEAKLTQQLRMPLLLSKDGTMDSTVAGVLRQNMLGMSAELREQILDEIWESVSSAMVGGVAAVAEFDEEDWDHYLTKARDLIDDRIQGSFRPKRRHLAQPDGFYRAVNTGKCSRTGDAIDPGDYFLVFHGNTVALPLMAAHAKELVEETVSGTISELPGTEVPPPWDGLPWEAESEDIEKS